MQRQQLLAIGLVIAWGLCGSSGASAAGQEEWERTLQAAKREGKVTLSGPTGADRREALTQAFQKNYGIQVDYQGLTVRESLPRILAERKAGQYLWDVYVEGTGLPLASVVHELFDPLEPALILPDVKDPKNWRGGALRFFDEGRRLLIMTPIQRGILFVNPNLVDIKEFKSYKTLLEPKWKGKIAIDDPRSPGPGQATFTFFFMHPELGPNFIRALFGQELVVLKDYSQEADFVGQGRVPVLVGGSDAVAEARIRQGVPITIIDSRQLREGSDVSPAVGNVAVFNKAPHPNAAKLYVNWLLSKEGQTIFSRATGYVSSRVDVPTDHALPWRVPVPGAIETNSMEGLKAREKVVQLLREIMGR